jgi:signal transduction histidine kinase
VLNLLSNALKHTQRGGKINVEFLNCNEKVLIVVNDNGEGIPDDKKDIVFDRFRQVNNSLSRANEGCGIGLALSKSLIELLDGRIWLKSTYGKGSAFFVEFPAVHANIDEAVMTIPENIENSILIEFSDINFY